MNSAKTLLRLLVYATIVQISTAQTTFWEQTNGPYGGIVNCLAVDSAGNVFAGAAQAGILRSTDRGDTWSHVTFLKNTSALSIVVNTSDEFFAVTTDTGIALSSDHGNTWRAASVGLTPNVYALAINQINDHIFAGTDRGVLRSTDSGNSWTQTGFASTNVHSLAVDSSGRVFAGLEKGRILRSTDDGQTWAQVDSLATPNQVAVLAISPVNQYVFAETNGWGLYRSTDHGGTWSLTGFPYGQFVSAITVTPSGVVFAGNNVGVYKSTDNGETWNYFGNGLDSTWVLSLAVGKNGDLFAGSRTSGVFKSTDEGLTWSEVNNGFTATIVYALCRTPAGNILSTGTAGSNIFRSTDLGNNWQVVSRLGYSVLSFAVDSSGNIFAGEYMGLLRSTDDGATWVNPFPNNSETWFLNSQINALAVSAQNNIFAAVRSFSGGYIGLLRSSDGGENWTTEGSPHAKFSSLTSIAGVTLFAASTDSGIYRTTDEGASWHAANSGLPIRNIRTMTVSPNAMLFAGSASRGVFRSIDSGATWTQSGLDYTYVSALFVDSTGNVFATTFSDDYSVHRSTDNGTTWQQVNGGLVNTNLTSYAGGAGNRVFAGSSGSGVFRNSTAQTSVGDLPQELPAGYALLQNYPNPFNPVTQITYELPRDSRVLLELFNVVGQKVATLVDRLDRAGQHRVQWNAGNSPGGVYFYRLQTGFFTETKKLILLR